MRPLLLLALLSGCAREDRRPPQDSSEVDACEMFKDPAERSLCNWRAAVER